MSVAAGIPHDEIRDLRDRSWTLTLIEALFGADERERGAIGETLRVLADPHAVPALTAIVVSPNRSPALREVASEALRGLGAPPAELVRRWWEHGDRVLRRHALRSMGDGAREVLEVAGDPRHPFHADAIGALTIGHREPAEQRLKLDALGHADAAVREAAARALSWDAPLAGEEPLLAALADPAPAVRRAARMALTGYDSRRALRALWTSAPPSGDGLRAEEAAAHFVEELQGHSRAVRARLEAWLEPVADLIKLGCEATWPSWLTSRVVAPQPGPGADEVLAILAIESGPWRLPREALGRVDPSAIEPSARAVIGARVLEHPDRDVRSLATAWLASWGDEARLRELLDEDDDSVRGSALYVLDRLPRSPALAATLLERFRADDLAHPHDVTVLCGYAAHAADGEVARVLVDATAHRHEGVRSAAVALLAERSAGAVLAPLMARLADPPEVTWAVHLALLDAAARLDLPAPAAAALVDVDSLRVQLALARLPGDPSSN